MRKARKLRGMTLVEIIISMFIFSVIALMMVQIGVVTKSLLMNSNHVNNKTSAESPVAAAQNYKALTDGTEYTAITDNNGTPVDVHEEVTFKITTSNGKTATQTWHKIRTGAAADKSGKNCDTNFDGDLEFYVYDKAYTGPTEAPAPEPTT